MKIDKIRHQKYILLDEKQSFDIVTLYLGYRCSAISMSFIKVIVKIVFIGLWSKCVIKKFPHIITWVV